MSKTGLMTTLYLLDGKKKILEDLLIDTLKNCVAQHLPAHKKKETKCISFLCLLID